ncbi:unnamed protein product [Dibothriocephalus latus]|uniref:BPTI/Kunitz inhibitor domain-containing protein n=1 Tax=Dibothriocephalus latus TaxID=60516 RepID=A0A3P6TKJ7_DIBLA|nr:unnamed protein product [Dibothriocephalus latus]
MRGAQSAAARGLVEDEVCKLPKDVGPCRGAFLRYYYDYETKRCDEFMYGGCKGNANNFESIVECQERCMTNSQLKAMFFLVCLIASYIYIYMYHFLFSTEPAEKAADVDVCKLPQDTGPCRALLPRFAYNDTIKACVPFTYGGCQGNGNNFETKEECEEKCMAPSVDPCKQPIKVGPCLALIPRYAFDSAAGECVEFMYGGCNPNDNNFETLEACQAKCPGSNILIAITLLYFVLDECKSMHTINSNSVRGFKKNICYSLFAGKTVKAAATDLCELPQDTGPCRARFIRYAYDGKAKACVPFTYGGCQGNENNFETKEGCEEKCMGTSAWVGLIYLYPRFYCRCQRYGRIE